MPFGNVGSTKGIYDKAMTTYRSDREVLIQKYRIAVLAARKQALRAQDENAKAGWFAHAAEWEALADEAEKSTRDDDKT